MKTHPEISDVFYKFIYYHERKTSLKEVCVMPMKILFDIIILNNKNPSSQIIYFSDGEGDKNSHTPNPNLFTTIWIDRELENIAYFINKCILVHCLSWMFDWKMLTGSHSWTNKCISFISEQRRTRMMRLKNKNKRKKIQHQSAFSSLQTFSCQAPGLIITDSAIQLSNNEQNSERSKYDWFAFILIG